MNLNNLFITFFLLIIISCTINESIDDSKKIVKTVIEKKDKIFEKRIEKNETNNSNNKNNSNLPLYVIGDPYFIEGIKYIPEENYKYNENGLATFYGPELHKKVTINNTYNNVLELLGRHKTLPIPSVVKLTNLENGLSVNIKINDRHNDNLSIIQVSRKVSQLLRFYKTGFARVNVKILSDPSKQLKIVTESMTLSGFDTTIESAPTESVIITDLEQDVDLNKKKTNIIDEPIELNIEKITSNNLFIKSYNFSSYDNAKIFAKKFTDIKYTIQNEGNSYSVIFGPLENIEANKLFSSLIDKGYNSTEIIIE